MTNEYERGVQGSRFVAIARSLNPSVRPRLQIADAVLTLVDMVVAVCNVLNDPVDSRPWDEKLESYFEQNYGHVDTTEIVAQLGLLSDERSQQSLVRWIKRIRGDTYVSFARRLLGAAQYHSLERALKEDAAVVALALRRGVRALMPYCVAWEDALGAMTPDQLRTVTQLDVVSVSLARLAIQLDQALGEKLLPDLPAELRSQLSESNARAFNVAHLADVMALFRPRVSEESAARVSSMNDYLARKLRGARDALQHSEDGVSQAANSLIELIDRLLREAFTQEAVLAWLDTNLPQVPDLSRTDINGVRRPTKMAEALCLVYGGGSVRREPTKYDDGTNPTLVHSVTARAIVSARARLQRLKHADNDQELDRLALEQLLASVEGALMIGLRLGFSLEGAESPRVSDLEESA